MTPARDDTPALARLRTWARQPRLAVQRQVFAALERTHVRGEYLDGLMAARRQVRALLAGVPTGRGRPRQ